MSAVEIITVIAAVSAAVVSIVNAIAAGWGRQAAQARGERAEQKLDVIHDLTNSNMTALKGQLATALDRIEKLETLLASHGPR